MKKIVFLFLINYFWVEGQINTTPNQITSPTPSIASIMNFVDIPVNTYTGVPDISIPVDKISTHSKDINVNLELKYHPSGISLAQNASDVGLGWSLLGGGTISRTIINEPDGIYNQIPNPYNAPSVFNDVYGFNFMGYSGSFLIKRDLGTNTFSLQIKEDGNSNLKIQYQMNSNTLNIDSFTIFDNQGYRYEFDTYDINVSQFYLFFPYSSGVTSIAKAPLRYRSAHHLTRIIDNNGVEIVNFTYSLFNTNVLGDPTYDTSIHKFDKIIITGLGKAIFNYSFHPSEYRSSDVIRLDDLIIKNSKLQTVKKISFEYSTSPITSNTEVGASYERRRILTRVKMFNDNENSNLSYNLQYKNSLPPENLLNDYVVGMDSFGYLNLINQCDYSSTGINSLTVHKTTPEYCTMDVLQKIEYPTGGCSVFDFESNTFSFTRGNNQYLIGNSGYYISNEKDNTTPTVFVSTNYNTSVSNTFQFEVTESKRYYFNFSNAAYNYPSGINPDPDNPKPLGVGYTLSKNNMIIINFDDYLFDDVLCIGKSLFLNPGIYTITMSTAGGLNTSGNITISVKLPNSALKEWTYGAGLRIKQIATFEFTVGQDYFENEQAYSTIVPNKLLKYEYNIFDNTNKSSGFLTFSYQDLLNTPDFKSTEIGYSNVKVSQLPYNGYELFTYNSPYENDITTITFNNNYIQWYWSHILGYKEGNLKKYAIYDKFDNILSQVENYFDFVDSTEPPIEVNVILAQEAFDSTSTSGISFTGGIYTHNTWKQLKSKTTKNYFYTNISTTPNILETNETYDYNPINKKISESTVTNSLGDVLKTKYFYHSGNSLFSQNRISEIEKIEKYKGTELLSTNKINYANNWSGNVSFLPQSIVTSKGSNTLESKIKYNKYDEYSNPLEVQQDSGVITSYIYGYNKTQPVAKLENIAYNSIPAALITAIQTVTDSATSTEAQVIAALNVLRSSTDANMVKAMITTYTYIPLVGVSTITDPKRDSQTFSYDSFGRLQNVKDRNGNILSENEYHYRP